MSAQTRVFGDKTFNAIGYGGMGLSIGYGSVGPDEERLKVAVISSRGGGSVVNLQLYYRFWMLFTSLDVPFGTPRMSTVTTKS